MTTFIYIVNGTMIETTEAFGQVWKEAIAIAKADHTEVWREVIRGEDVRREFYAKGGCFLNERFYKPEKARVF